MATRKNKRWSHRVTRLLLAKVVNIPNESAALRLKTQNGMPP